jgi:hypothetical protein
MHGPFDWLAAQPAFQVSAMAGGLAVSLIVFRESAGILGLYCAKLFLQTPHTHVQRIE